MARDPIFQTLHTESLPELARTLTFDPIAGSTPAKLLSALSETEQTRWLDAHRNELEDHLSFVGSSFLSYMAGNGKSYRQVVMDMADKLNAVYRPQDSTIEIEQSIVSKVWNDTVARMTAEQRQELLLQTEALAAKYGVRLSKEMTGLAALTVAQMSGFGVYLLGSTLLGAINGALGLGLSFGAFTGLSSLISTVIGPVGWATLGLFTVLKLGRPNYKKLLPAIILIATARAAQDPGVLPKPIVVKTTPTKETGKATEQSPQTTMHPVVLKPSSASDMEAQHRREARWTSAVPPANPVIRELQWEIARATENRRDQSKQTLNSAAPLRLRSSRQEKNVFDLKNRTLATFAHNLVPETHYLDLEPAEKVLVDEMFEQNRTMEEEAALEREEVERLRDEHRKRERRLRHKGKIQQVDEERKKNFDAEFPELARGARDWDQSRHYLELSAEEQELIKAYAAEERKASVSNARAGDRLSQLERDFASASAQRSGAISSVGRFNGEAKKLKALWAVNFPKIDFQQQPLRWCAEQDFGARLAIERALRRLADEPDPVRLSRSKMHNTHEHHLGFTIPDGVVCRLFYVVNDGNIEISRMCQRKDC